MSRLPRTLLFLPPFLLGAFLLLEGALLLFLGPARGGTQGADRLARAFHEALLEPDALCIESLRRDVQVLWPLREPGQSLEAYAAREPIEIRTNSRGMRMREVTPVKPPNVFRIAILGDSVTFGWGVPESATFARVLERSLRASIREHEIEVLNHGVPGHTTLQAWKRLERDVLPFSPDVVVLATGFNDSFFTRHQADEARLEREPPRPFPNPSWFLRRSRLFTLLFGESEGISPTHPHHPRVEPDDAQSLRRELVRAVRGAGSEIVLLNACFPHAAIGDALSEIALELDVPHLDGRAVLLERPPRERTPETRTVRVPLHLPSEREEDPASFLALARPETPFDDAQDLEFVPARRAEDGSYFFELELPRFQDVACVPRTYLDTAPKELERLSYLTFHRIDPENPEPLRPGRFRGSRYLATDAPFFAKMVSESVHPGIRGHEELARALEVVLRNSTALGALR